MTVCCGPSGNNIYLLHLFGDDETEQDQSINAVRYLDEWSICATMRD